MSYQPGCWHCTHPRAWWGTVAFLLALLFAGQIVLAACWVILLAVVLWANIGQRILCWRTV